MITGIGIDIVEIKRVQKLKKRYPRGFLNRIFTAREIEYCGKKPVPCQHYAGKFAAKEALIKALGRPLPLKEIEVERPLGKAPQIKLHGAAKRIMGNKKIFISISHDHEYAIAQVVLEVS